jgi:hypothetical protein
MPDIDLHIWKSKFKLHTYHVINGDDYLRKRIDWKLILENIKIFLYEKHPTYIVELTSKEKVKWTKTQTYVF